MSYADLEGDNNASDGQTTGFHAGLYGDVVHDPWEFDGSLQLACLQQEQSRHGVSGLGAISQTASASFDSVAAEANARVGYAFDVVQATVTPFVAAEGRVMRNDGYTKTGAGVFNITVASSTITQAEIGPGLRTDRTLSVVDTWEVAGAFDAAYGYVLGDHTPATHATLLGRSITSSGAEIGRHVATIGAELSLDEMETGLSASLRYEGRFRENALSHSLMGSVMVPF